MIDAAVHLDIVFFLIFRKTNVTQIIKRHYKH